MKKSTILLLALLGFGLYKQFMDKKQAELPQEQDPRIIIRKLHDQFEGDSVKVINAIAETFKIAKEQANATYEQFMIDLQEDANFGLQ
jgi:hypothetical protein